MIINQVHGRIKIRLCPIENPYFMANYDITIDNEKFILNPMDIASLDIVPIGYHQFHALRNNHSYKIKIVQKMGLLTTKTQKINNIKAPMPGLIIDVIASKGQKIEPGTPLIVLSAMKMENIITSHGEGVIKSINVKVNDTVDKGQLIIEME